MNYRYFGAYRFLLALVVVIGHFQANHSPVTLGTFGYSAVMLFFVLSGFIITEAIENFYKDRPLAFMANRLMRIVPPFLFALAVSILIHLAVSSSGLPVADFNVTGKEIWKNVRSVFDYKIAIGKENYYPFVRYVWAIVIELQFYFSAGILFWMFRNSLPVIGVGILSWVLYTFSGFEHGLVAQYAPYFAFGILLHRQNHLLTLLGAALLIALYPKVEFVLGLSLLIGLCFVKANLKSIDQFLGNLSYPLYLNHFAVEIGLYGLTQTKGWGILILGIFLSVLLSIVAHYSVEPLIKGVRDRLRGKSVPTVHFVVSTRNIS